MANPSKAKGTAAESAFRDWCNAMGPFTVERRALNGARDLGDIAGIPHTIVEIKNCKTLAIPQWMRETAVEQRNGLALYGWLTYKPRGVTDPGMWPGIVPNWQMLELIKHAVIR